MSLVTALEPEPIPADLPEPELEDRSEPWPHPRTIWRELGDGCYVRRALQTLDAIERY